MEKLTFNISPEEWGNLVTKYNADTKKVSSADFTDGTVNVESDVTGSLTKRKGGPNYNTTLLAAAPKDQYEAIFSDGARHLLVVQSGEIKYSSGDTIFNTVVNGSGFSSVANFEFATTQDRVYGGNGVNAPQVYDRTTSYGGVAYTAPRMKTMGAQAPSSAPTAGAPTAGGNVPNGAHTYKITFLYYDSEESNGSPVSGVQTAATPNNTIPLTTIPIGGYGVTARKIYRDNNDGLWLHIATLADNTTTIFNDTIAVGVTPTEIPTDHDTPPTFSRITLWLDQLWVSGVPGDPYTLFFSDTSMPDIFPDSNQVLCNQEDAITGHVVYFDRLIVFNRRSMGQILGKTSDTYRYAAIPSSVGCVDNRTIQIRVIEGVPILLWLSDRGFYSYDGNSIDYISDVIEDLVNFNIQQALQQKNSIAQTTFTGTSDPGIDLTSIPGSITTKGYLNGTATLGTNPRRNLDDQTDWELGTTTNLALRTGNTLKTVNGNGFAGHASAVITGDMVSPSIVQLTTVSDFTGENNGTSTTGSQLTGTANTQSLKFAQKINVLTRAGTITQVKMRVVASATSETYRITVYEDVAGVPGTALFTGPVRNPAVGEQEVTETVSIARSASSTVWIGFEKVASTTLPHVFLTSSSVFPTTSKRFFGGAWQDFSAADATSAGVSSTTTKLKVGFTFLQTAVSKSGTWTSILYDTGSNSLNQGFLTTSVAFNNLFGSKTFSVSVEGSLETTPTSFSQLYINSGRTNLTNQSFTISGQRYLRIKISMSTTDDRDTDQFGTATLKFPSPVTWDSGTIDTSGSATTYDEYSSVVTNSGDSTVTFQIATNTVDSGWGGSGNGPGQFGAFGSHIVRQYVKLRAVFTSSTANPPMTSVVSSITFKWTIVANYTSTIIDTGVNPPAGWDLFLAEYETNGGTVAFQMRSATTSGGIPAATFFSVTPSEFPTLVPPNQFVQWRVIITSDDEDVPEVESVTVQWFISSVNSIRPASIFVDGRYYVALAEVGSLVNNILLQLDLKGKWRRLADLSIATFSFFFNRPYFGLATSGQIRKFLDGNTDAGSAIQFDWRTKAFDYSTKFQENSSKVKTIGEVILKGRNTGATFQLFYSVDEGDTFIAMLTSSGSTSFVSGTDNKNFFVRWRPLWDGSNPISGRTLMYRVFSNDVNPVEITSLELTAFLRNQVPVITG